MTRYQPFRLEVGTVMLPLCCGLEASCLASAGYTAVDSQAIFGQDIVVLIVMPFPFVHVRSVTLSCVLPGARRASIAILRKNCVASISAGE